MIDLTMRHLPRVAAFLFAASVLTPVSFAQGSGVLGQSLSTTQQESLSPKALQAYRKALSNADHILYDMALDDLHRAARLDPKHMPLQFVSARAHRSRARNKTGAEAKALYSRAMMSLDRVTTGSAATNEQIVLAQKSRKMIETTLAGLQEREDRRNALGKAIQRDYVSSRVTRSGGLGSGGLVGVGSGSGSSRSSGGGSSSRSINVDISFSSSRGSSFSNRNSNLGFSFR